MNDRTIVVAGATGNQGGAVARHLVQSGWNVRAIVRDPEKDSAKALAKLGIELQTGDLDDPPSLERALTGAWGVFSVQNFWLPDVGFDGEIRQGKALADAARAASIGHFVYSSVGAAHRGEGQKHFESKWIVEQHIREIGIPATIVRPVAFMDNIEWLRAPVSNGLLPGMGTRNDKATQLIAVDDIGAVVAAVFANAQTYLGRTLEIAGDEITEPEKASILARVIGRPVTLQQPDGSEGEQDEEQAAMGRFFNGIAYDADIKETRRVHPGAMTFEQYLRRNGWEDLPVLPMPQSSESWGS